MIIDIMLVVFALAGFYLGYTRGIAGTLLVIAGYVVALLLTLKLSPLLAEFMIRTVKAGKLFALIFGTIITLVVLIFVVHRLARRTGDYLTKHKPPSVSKISGGMLMVFVAVFFYTLVLWTLDTIHMIGEKARSSSLSFATLIAVPTGAKQTAELTKPLFLEYWHLMEDTIKEQQEKEQQQKEQQPEPKPL